MHTNNDNVVSDNLPIYFIWFGSDVPQQYLDNLQRAAETNKSRDIILVYSEKHLLENNRKNIDSIENINSVFDIQKRVEVERNDNIQNLFKIDVYDMELDEQDHRIYDLLNKAFAANFSDSVRGEVKSFKYCIASNIIRLPLLNVVGGIYLDIDSKVDSKIIDIKCKNGYGIHSYYHSNNGNKQFDFLGNIIIKTKVKWCDKPGGARYVDAYEESHEGINFDDVMRKYFNEVDDVFKEADDALNDRRNFAVTTSSTNCLSKCIISYYIDRFVDEYKKENNIVSYSHVGSTFYVGTLELIFRKDGNIFIKEKIDDQIVQSKLCDPIIADYGINIPQSIKLKMEEGEGYNTDYNDPEQLKELGLDKQDDAISCKLEHSSLEQTENSQRER